MPQRNPILSQRHHFIFYISIRWIRHKSQSQSSRTTRTGGHPPPTDAGGDVVVPTPLTSSYPCPFSPPPTPHHPPAGLAILRDLRTSPKKLTVAAQLVNGRHIRDALVLAQSVPNKALGFVFRALKLARGEAVMNKGYREDDLVVQRVTVGKGTHLKRLLIHGRGRAGRMHKHRAHLRLHVGPGDARPTVQVLLPWLIRSRLKREAQQHAL